MSSATSVAEAPEGAAEGKKGGNKKLILLALPVVLITVGAGLWFSGILPGMLGMSGHEAEHGAHAEAAAPSVPVFVELPDIIANLNTAKRGTFVKLKAKLELSREADAAAAKAAMPRLQDLFTTYLRDMRPEELRGSVGTYRLREELIARANVALNPVRVRDILFVELLVQ
jgi:flagellar FliL protein